MRPHDVVLRGPACLGGGAAPVVVRRTDQRFVEGLFRDLESEEGRQRLRASVLPAGDDATLYLPIHRCQNIVIVEAVCDRPGQPRIDPRKLQGAGVVIRRRRGAARPERWLRYRGAIHGWIASGTTEEGLDPEARRRHRPSAGNAHIDRVLARRRPQPVADDEAFVRLHAVPPRVCEAVGATLLFAVVQPVEPHVAEVQGADVPTVDDDTARILMPGWLRHHTTPSPVPGRFGGARFRVRDAGTADRPVLQIERDAGSGFAPVTDLPNPWDTRAGGSQHDEGHFVRMLWQVCMEWDTFGGRPDGARLAATLDAVSMPLGNGTTTTLGAFLRDACEVFVRREPGASVRCPTLWPAIPVGTETALRGAVRGALQAQVARFSSTEPRYGNPAARYDLHAFARVQAEEGCPPHLVWATAPARGFRVARWFDGCPSGVAVPAIELPDLSRDTLKRLGPNFAIKVPRSMFNFLANNDPKDLLAGDATNDQGGPSFQWICSLNLSITFMVAFMLLISFVFLLNFVFWWVPFFRICIPIPTSEPESA